jgi:hypothetical protein
VIIWLFDDLSNNQVLVINIDSLCDLKNNNQKNKLEVIQKNNNWPDIGLD